jgi:hypothetical protein
VGKASKEHGPNDLIIVWIGQRFSVVAILKHSIQKTEVRIQLILAALQTTDFISSG